MLKRIDEEKEREKAIAELLNLYELHGPNLEFIHAHPLSDATTNQNGLIMFAVTFPDPGQYKIYLQTQAGGQVNTTDYVFSVKVNPSNNSNSNDSMQNMDHMGH